MATMRPRNPSGSSAGTCLCSNRFGMRSHGGPSIRKTSSNMSSQRKTAPCARSARRKDDVFGPVSWLAGHSPSSPSRALSSMTQWHNEEGLTAYSCGRSFGIGLPSTRTSRTEFPLSINAINVPKHRNLDRSFRCCQLPGERSEIPRRDGFSDARHRRAFARPACSIRATTRLGGFFDLSPGAWSGRGQRRPARRSVDQGIARGVRAAVGARGGTSGSAAGPAVGRGTRRGAIGRGAGRHAGCGRSAGCRAADGRTAALGQCKGACERKRCGEGDGREFHGGFQSCWRPTTNDDASRSVPLVPEANADVISATTRGPSIRPIGDAPRPSFRPYNDKTV